MALIKSISGIRGTIGGKPGSNLSPLDIVKFTAAYAGWLQAAGSVNTVVIGRDGRMSGKMVSNLCSSTLLACGFDVIDIGITTTPTVEIAVKKENAGGGIILTASHNPKEWNALKLLNSDGEFLDAEAGKTILSIAEKEEFNFVGVEKIGKYFFDDGYLNLHISAVVNYPLVDVAAIKKAKLKNCCRCYK